MNKVSRRAFVTSAAALAAGAASRGVASDAVVTPAVSTGASSFFDLIRIPDRVTVFVDAADNQQQSRLAMVRSGSRWQARGVEVSTLLHTQALNVSTTVSTTVSMSISVTTPSTNSSVALTRIHLRWALKPLPSLLYMGDAWERSYGELAWRTVVPERVMPWYFAAHDAGSIAGAIDGSIESPTHAYGVMTAPAAFCFWQVDPQGVSLWLDVSNGGKGVLLGQRELAAATVVSRQGHAGEPSAHAVTDFCRKMCPRPRLPAAPVYGTNNWYYSYGDSNAEGVLRDTDLVVALAPKSPATGLIIGPRPFSVVDGGWEGDAAGVGAQAGKTNAGFPDMARLAQEIRSRGARPGIWIRPMIAPQNTGTGRTGAELLLPMTRFQSAADNEPAYDPTIPEALEAVLDKMKQVVAWKYELVKHDFSTYDVLGQWGPNMGAQPARPGWSFHDRSRTTAEILLDLYRALRAAAGNDTLLLGCNTVGHLAAGVFEMQRTGDDTSGRQWERTRRMGINTLAYRLPQNETFYRIDADCVGITRDVPWEMNRQWMDLLARSGTALFISPGPDAIGAQQRSAIERAFAMAASAKPGAYAADWFSNTTPEHWEFPAGAPKHYAWSGEDGSDPVLL